MNWRGLGSSILFRRPRFFRTGNTIMLTSLDGEYQFVIGATTPPTFFIVGIQNSQSGWILSFRSWFATGNSGKVKRMFRYIRKHTTGIMLRTRLPLHLVSSVRYWKCLNGRCVIIKWSSLLSFHAIWLNLRG